MNSQYVIEAVSAALGASYHNDMYGQQATKNAAGRTVPSHIVVTASMPTCLWSDYKIAVARNCVMTPTCLPREAPDRILATYPEPHFDTYRTIQDASGATFTFVTCQGKDSPALSTWYCWQDLSHFMVLTVVAARRALQTSQRFKICIWHKPTDEVVAAPLASGHLANLPDDVCDMLSDSREIKYTTGKMLQAIDGKEDVYVIEWIISTGSLSLKSPYVWTPRTSLMHRYIDAIAGDASARQADSSSNVDTTWSSDDWKENTWWYSDHN